MTRSVKSSAIGRWHTGTKSQLFLDTAVSRSSLQSAMVHNGKLFIETVGCQMNVLDSELVVAALRQQGYELTGDPKQADTVLFNTCSVREHAEEKIYSALGRLKFSKRSRPQQVIGVIGCMAQKDQNKIFERAPHVDIVVGTGQLGEIPRLIEDARTDRKRTLAVSLDRKGAGRAEVAASFESYDPLRDPQMRPTPWQAFVRIMIGCDKFCTYCVVPMTRGPEQSRPPADIIREVKTLAEQGVREITFLGQTVNSYKYNQDGKRFRLSDLIAAVHDTPSLLRIKFVTSFPKDMSDDLLQAVRDFPKCSRYLHVPLQHGCDEVLARMKRGYTTADYRDMMQRIRETLPDASVSSDFIVGFCGETEEAFQKSMDAVREYRFKNSFIFKYSPRSGTKAHELLADDIPEDVKRRRNQELLILQNEISEEDNADFIGRTLRVLVEGPSKSEEKRRKRAEAEVALTPENHELAIAGFHSAWQSESDDAETTETPATGAIQLVGRTNCDRIVVFDGNPRLAGTFADVSVSDCTTTTLVGSIMTGEHQHVELLSLQGLSG